MHIFFNGDSNMNGEELDDRSQSMANCIAKYFKADSTTNLAVSGGSNDLIYNTTWEWLQNNPKPDLVVIGWTEVHREQWWFEGRFHEILHLDVGYPVPTHFRRRHHLWKTRISTDGNWARIMGYYWHNKIYNLHTYLTEKGIEHVFWNAFNAFPLDDDREHLDWHERYILPYASNSTYVNFCKEKGFREITPGWEHYPPEAHQAWADFVIKEMKRVGRYDSLLER